MRCFVNWTGLQDSPMGTNQSKKKKRVSSSKGQLIQVHFWGQSFNTFYTLGRHKTIGLNRWFHPKEICNSIIMLWCSLSSLHNIILNSFCSFSHCGVCYFQVMLFSFLRPTHTMWTFHLHKNFFEQLWCRKEKGFSPVNSLHNTKTTHNVFYIILWRLLLHWSSMEIFHGKILALDIQSII